MPRKDGTPIAAAYGAGVNSTAMLVGSWERQELPDVVTFADTGGEKPETYHHLFAFDAWLAAHGFPRVGGLWHRPPNPVYTRPEYGLPETHPLAVLVPVRNDGKYITLENNCRTLSMLPSLAYGGRSCSEKYKLRPQHKFLKTFPPTAAWWCLDRLGRSHPPAAAARVRLVEKWLGYHADEARRGDITGDDFYQYRYPLKEWGWGQVACQEASQRAGLAVPGKSSCWFCPASTKVEVLQLGRLHPPLALLSVQMEEAARSAGNLKTVKGLGRRFSWGEFLAQPGSVRQADPPQAGCICQSEIVEGAGIDADVEEEE